MLCESCCEDAATASDDLCDNCRDGWPFDGPDDLRIPAEAREILASLPPTPRTQRIAIERMRREGGRIMGGARKRTPRDAKAAAVAEKARRVRLYASQWAEREELTYLPSVPPGVADLTDRMVRRAVSFD